MKTQRTPVQKCRAEVGRIHRHLRNVDYLAKNVRILHLRQAADRLELVCIALRDHLAYLEKQEELPLVEPREV